MTVYERIKNMSVEEMASVLSHLVNNPCVYCERKICSREKNVIKCYNGIGGWLKKEEKEGRKKVIKSKRCWTNASDITDMVKTRLYFNVKPFLFDNFIQQIINDDENVTDAKLYNYATQIKNASDTTDFIADIMFRLSKCTYTIYYEVTDNETN